MDESPRAPSRDRGRWARWCILLLLVVTAVVFRPVLGHELTNWDDDLYTKKIPQLTALTAANVGWMLTDTSHFYWHPLSYLLHTVENVLFGDEARLYHLVSLLLHAANAVLVFLLARRLLTRWRAPGGIGIDLASLLATLLFALHPLRVESVAWMSEQKGLLATLLMLLAVHAWLSYGGGERPRLRPYLLALAAFLLAILAKPLAVTLPVVLLVLDLHPLRRFGVEKTGRLILEKLPFLVPALLAAWLSASDPRQSELMPTLASAGDRLVASLWGFVFPLLRTVWPDPLVPFYPLELTERLTLANSRYYLSALFLVVVTGLCVWRFARGRPVWLAAWAAYLVTLAPMSGLRKAASLATADRFSYLPTIVWFLLLAAGVRVLWERWARRGIILVVGLGLVVLLLLLARARLPVWRDSESLWLRVAEVYPVRAVVAHNNLGAIYHARAVREDRADLLERARRRYETAVRLPPDHASSHNNLGLIHRMRGDYGPAERHLLLAVEHQPEFSLAHANLAVLYLLTEDGERARHHYRLAIETGQYVDPRILGLLEERLR